MKKVLLALTLAATATVFAGEKVEIKTDSARIKSYAKKGICKIIEDGKVISMRGNTSSKSNAWRSMITVLLFKAPAEKKFTFGGEVKLEKAKGKFSIAVRMINNKGKSITYSFYTMTKDTDWKKFSQTFTAAPGTVKMQLYILAQNLGDDTRAYAKNIYVEAID
jgi:hypothetical protein